MKKMLRPFIDAHIHLNTVSIEKMQLAQSYGAGLLSINTDIPFFESLEKQEATIHELQKQFGERLQYITSFHNHYWNTDKWLSDVLSQIQKGIANGAVGVKLWKNIGLDDQLKDKDGQFVMVDDQRFDPLYEYLIDNNILLIGHQGEPRNCWLPLESMSVDSDREYFSKHPEYHMYVNPEYPSYEDQMLARNRMLEKHPELQYVGLHLFSMEWSIDEVAALLERFPKTMTDLAERICHVQLQTMENREAVRNFFIKYQDRIIYGTDIIDDGSIPPTELRNRLESLWNYHWRFFASDEKMEAPEFKGTFKGLALPDLVLEKIFRDNAIKTYQFSKELLT